MGDDVIVVEDDGEAYDDGTVARIRILDGPKSEKFPDGWKYAFHCGEAGADDPIIRFDNHHGPHELHLGPRIFEIEFPGFETVFQIWRAALSPEKRTDWSFSP